MFSPHTLPKKFNWLYITKKFNTSNLINSNNTSPSTAVLDRTNVIYLFKCDPGRLFLQRKEYDCWSSHYNSFQTTNNTP